MGGGDWIGCGPVHPDPHPHCHSDSNSKKAEITFTRGVDAKCNYLREVRRSGQKVHVKGPWRPREVLEIVFFHLGSQIE